MLNKKCKKTRNIHNQHLHQCNKTKKKEKYNITNIQYNIKQQKHT